MEHTTALSMFMMVRIGNICNMYTTIVLIKCNDEEIFDKFHNYLTHDCFAEIDQEVDDTTQYTIITKYEPDLSEFENLVNKYQYAEPIVQYVTVSIDPVYIDLPRRFNGVWYND